MQSGERSVFEILITVFSLSLSGVDMGEVESLCAFFLVLSRLVFLFVCSYLDVTLKKNSGFVWGFSLRRL